MLRDEDDLELMAELAGVLDQTVTAEGLSAGTYLILRELVRHEGATPVTGLAAQMGADPEEVAELCGRLVQDGLARPRPDGVMASAIGRERAAEIEDRANEAMRAYVLDRPHSATIYGLVASMQAGRFTVEDLIAFVQQGPEEAEGE